MKGIDIGIVNDWKGETIKQMTWLNIQYINIMHMEIHLFSFIVLGLGLNIYYGKLIKPQDDKKEI